MENNGIDFDFNKDKQIKLRVCYERSSDERELYLVNLLEFNVFKWCVSYNRKVKHFKHFKEAVEYYNALPFKNLPDRIHDFLEKHK